MTTWKVPATVKRVIDGDSIAVQLDLGWKIYYNTTIRVAGMDAPELNTDQGKLAREYVTGLLPAGTIVTVVSHSLDKYGRVLGAVLLPDGTNLTELLISQGFAIEY